MATNAIGADEVVAGVVPTLQSVHRAVAAVVMDVDSFGLADEGDTIAAMVTAGRSQEEARRMLARASEDGRVDLLGFQALLDECVTLNLSGNVTASVRQRVCCRWAPASETRPPGLSSLHVGRRS